MRDMRRGRDLAAADRLKWDMSSIGLAPSHKQAATEIIDTTALDKSTRFLSSRLFYCRQIFGNGGVPFAQARVSNQNPFLIAGLMRFNWGLLGINFDPLLADHHAASS
jgi:hypothetical protein